MAREYARVNMAIWQDDNYRALPPLAQHLYFVMWTHPGLSYCGVLDWRPGRIAAMAGGWTAQDVRDAAAILTERVFLVIDEESEEALIRSWARYDGLMRQPRMAVSLANAYASVASKTLRGVIIHELTKLHAAQPALACWTKPDVASMLTLTAIDPHGLPTVSAPASAPFAPGFGKSLAQTSPSVSVPPTPSPAPTPLLQLQEPTTSSSEIADVIPDPAAIRSSTIPMQRVTTPGDRHDVEALCVLLADLIHENGAKMPKITKGWRDAARLLLDKDGYSAAQVEWVARWAANDEFWRSNILSMPTLREKFEQLKMTSMRDRAPASGGRPAPMDRLAATVALGAQMQAEADRAQIESR